jgi:(R,R)-butanediol dehydrogenase/meso-butanediol dehydrogenase/diacetyl reductase
VRAALITGAGQLEIRDFPDPTPTDAGVVVDVTFCGVCGTDVHAFTSGRAYAPAICGHEWTGTISAVGRSVSRLAEGDRVVVGVPPACGSCAACRADRTRHCITSHAFARGRDPEAPPHGGFARRIAVNADRVIAAHPELDDETLAQVEPVTVALHAVHQSGIRAGDTAVVQGAGPVGLTTMQCVRAAGAGQVIVIEPSATRRAVAADLGATRAAPPEAAGELIADHTQGLGADLVYDCAGGGDTLRSAVDLARRGGSVCLVAFTDGPTSIDPGAWLRKEISVTTALAYLHDEFEAAMDMLADGRVRVDSLHTSTTQMDGLAAVLQGLARGDSTQMKVLVDPNWSFTSS